ncbi:unnamed protein product [Didymodactylos carnosus]|uniref:Uncharacterized protein n=1 Tax=Didymodactylos carnosus TaxID=1234261 RepID=A0A8S2EBD9_9BILA|nr:unnamed protein product [Didymodactylos carnosus]CAF3992116.1 unnamed protein product [Didymodactylos carnosus]
MSNNQSKGLTQQVTNLFQNATAQIKNTLNTTTSNSNTMTNNRSDKSGGPEKFNECIIYEKPSTIDDTEDCFSNMSNKPEINQDLFKRGPDIHEEDKFRACFIDCSCDCSAKKVTHNNIVATQDLGIIEKLMKNMKQSAYDVLCDCRCGDNQQRSFSFNYSAGEKRNE